MDSCVSYYFHRLRDGLRYLALLTFDVLIRVICNYLRMHGLHIHIVIP